MPPTQPSRRGSSCLLFALVGGAAAVTPDVHSQGRSGTDYVDTFRGANDNEREGTIVPRSPLAEE
jgi:hypothetical protein